MKRTFLEVSACKSWSFNDSSKLKRFGVACCLTTDCFIELKFLFNEKELVLDKIAEISGKQSRDVLCGAMVSKSARCVVRKSSISGYVVADTIYDLCQINVP